MGKTWRRRRRTDGSRVSRQLSIFLRNIDWEGKSRRRIDFPRTAAGREGQRTRHKIFLLPREQIDLSPSSYFIFCQEIFFAPEKHMCLGSPTGLKTLEGETKQD